MFSTLVFGLFWLHYFGSSRLVGIDFRARYMDRFLNETWLGLGSAKPDEPGGKQSAAGTKWVKLDALGVNWSFGEGLHDF
ncbi:MAG: hypothetical protein CFR70_00415 [Rhodocyclaceae bacterium]|nr:MAG: hypothetical protein CFR70_00415 [Rhodocyclaceae bacterium]